MILVRESSCDFEENKMMNELPNTIVFIRLSVWKQFDRLSAQTNPISIIQNLIVS